MMRVKPDPERGHIALLRERDTMVTFTDLGTVLQVWQCGNGVELDPASARELGEALVAWADRKTRCRICGRSAGQEHDGAAHDARVAVMPTRSDRARRENA